MMKDLNDGYKKYHNLPGRVFKNISQEFSQAIQKFTGYQTSGLGYFSDLMQPNWIDFMNSHNLADFTKKMI